jgi:hypothetical protein
VKETLVPGDFPAALAIWNSTASTLHRAPCRHRKEGVERENPARLRRGEELLKAHFGSRNRPSGAVRHFDGSWLWRVCARSVSRAIARDDLRGSVCCHEEYHRPQTRAPRRIDSLGHPLFLSLKRQ